MRHARHPNKINYLLGCLPRIPANPPFIYGTHQQLQVLALSQPREAQGWTWRFAAHILLGADHVLIMIALGVLQFQLNFQLAEAIPSSSNSLPASATNLRPAPATLPAPSATGHASRVPTPHSAAAGKQALHEIWVFSCRLTTSTVRHTELNCLWCNMV